MHLWWLPRSTHFGALVRSIGRPWRRPSNIHQATSYQWTAAPPGASTVRKGVREMPEPYIDNYRSCARTYATFRCYPQDFPPDEVTHILGIEPSRTSLSDARPGAVNGWFLTTNGMENSRDARKHIDCLLDQLVPRSREIQKLRDANCRMDMTCFWESAEGNGGPILSPPQMRRLAELGCLDRHLNWIAMVRPPDITFS